MRPIDLYLRALAECRTENDFNRLHISIETFSPPAEFAAIAEYSQHEPLPFQSMRWIARTRQMLASGGLPIQAYGKEELAPGIHLYRDGTGAPEHRTLVVAFAGDAQRLMLPITVFLQHCPAERFEFLVLRDFSRCYYLRGITPLAEDFPSLLAAIERLVDHRRYRRTFVLGTSGGGLAAVAAAIGLGADVGIGICATSPTLEDPRMGPKGLTFAPFEDLLASRSRPLPEIRLTYGADCARDAEKACALAGLVPARLLPVAGVTAHNLLVELGRAGRLRPFLAELLETGS